VPLHLEPWEWDKLKGSPSPMPMVDVNCGDHGSDVIEELELAATPSGIRKTSRTFECSDKGRRGRLINQSTQ
jgi:hypothetical protein